jgi:uncharacterized RDD family membrane protein YckC
MDWYYAAGGRQAGPVSDAALAELVQTGAVRGDTLVWHSGLPNWVPYGQVAPAPAAGAAVGPAGAGGTTFCSECGRPFSANDLVRFGDRWVCGNCKELFAQKLREGAAPQGAMVYAGFWIRVGAMFIDGLILGAVAGVVVFVMALALMPILRRSAGAPDAAMMVASAMIGMACLLLLAGAACYEAILVSRWGATIGKRALGLRVVMQDGGGLSLGRAFGRHFAKILSGIPLDFGFIMVAFDQEKRGLHDYICGTRVIRT